MLTDRERELIAAYLPSPRDPDLGDEEYYCKDGAGRVQKVRLVSILCYLEPNPTIYGLEYADSGKHFTGFYGEAPWDGEPMWNLYDNRDDCRADTHMMYEHWEDLRRKQREEEQ